MARAWGLTLSVVVLLGGAAGALAQQDFSKVEITSEKLAEGVYMLKGAGGNIGLSVGADAAFLVDDQYAPLTPKIKAAVAALTPKPVKFVLNTHWHGDHSGGNKDFGESGTLIVAHENVRKRMSTEQFIEAFGMKTPPSEPVALPVVTFADSVTFHLNGDEIQAFHVAPAHTDGDSVIHFRKANVLHGGDTFFNGMYPFIDLSSGGSVAGMIAAADRMLALANDTTKIIPGHGPLGTKADLKAYRDMLATARDRVAALVKAGKTLEQVTAAKPLADLDAKWGQGFLKADPFVSILYKDLSRSTGN
ncbi:MAG TPA: MBL fold metallo-hydrolase [Vicinamibacteria bacterium]|nr:MBL fold metallo-hydrolase [Vicinamibacteria bacterium]